MGHRYGELSQMPKTHELLVCFTFFTRKTDIKTLDRLRGANMFTSACAISSVCLSTKASLSNLFEVEDNPSIVAERCQILLDSRKGPGCLDTLWMQATYVPLHRAYSFVLKCFLVGSVSWSRYPGLQLARRLCPHRETYISASSTPSGSSKQTPCAPLGKR